MSPTEDTICPNEKCKKPLTAQYHTFLKFRSDGVPQATCHRDPTLDPCPLFEGAYMLWKRVVAAEEGGALARKTSELSDALTVIARLELTESQQKSAIAKYAEVTAKAIADAVKAAKDGMQVDLDKAQAQLTFKEGLLTEAEATIVALNGKIVGLTESLDAQTAHVKEAEARAAAAVARAAQLSKCVVVLAEKETEIEILSVESDGAVDPNDVVDLDQRKPNGARAVPPPPPAPQFVAPTAPAVVVLDPPPAAPMPVPAPAAAAQTVLVCMCCDKPAVKIAKDKWELKTGGHFPEIVSCRKVASHADAIYGILDENRELLVNPPDDSSEVPSMFEDINPST